MSTEIKNGVPVHEAATAGVGPCSLGSGCFRWATRAGERPTVDLDFYQQLYFHKLGTKTEADTYALGKDFPRHRGDQPARLSRHCRRWS